MQMSNTKKFLKTSNGITLIALVITIIVLLILAGISISMLSGNNGILQKATQSKEKTERSEIIEMAQMDILGKKTENHGSLSDQELIEILTSDDYNTKGTLSNEESVLDRTLTSKDEKYTIAVSEIYNGNLEISPPPIIDYGTKTAETVAVGDDITIGTTEKFKIIKKSADGKTITAMPYYNLMLNETPIKQIVSENAGQFIGSAGTLAFSSDNTAPYWNAGTDIAMNELPETNKKNNVQTYIESYQKTLEDLGANNVTVRIARYSELNETGITEKLRNPGEVGNYWIGSANSSSASNVYYVYYNGYIYNYGFNNADGCGVRPLIIITL